MIRSLRIFCDLVQTQSFTEAAQRNYLTQSAVSHHVKALEDKFGKRLLERSRKPLKLTRAGKLVCEGAKEILKRYEQIKTALQQPLREVSGTFRIATTIAVGLHELPPYLTAFLKRYPRAEPELVYLKAPEIYQAILSHQADVGLLAYPKPHSQLKIDIFKKDTLVAILPPNHPRLDSRRISLQDLHNQPFVMLQARLPTRSAIDRILHKARLRVKVVHTFDDIEIVKRAVEVGLGVSVVPRGTVLSETRAGTLKQLEIREGPFIYPIGLLTRRGTEQPMAAQKFIRSLLPPRP